MGLAVLCLGGRAEAIEKASEQVSPFYGSLSRSVPIEVPGFRGLEPKLAFSYSSEGRNGFLGVGWNLSGISTIERVNEGLGTPRWNPSDTYTLDGQALVPCGGIVSPSCTSGGSHATKDESYLKILFEAGANTWTVWGRDGTRTIFSPTLQPTPEHTLRWGQTSAIDTKGNTVTTTWTCPPGEDCYPEAISYNGYSIAFNRESTQRPDPLTFAAADVIGKTLYRLRSVFVRLGSTPIRAYRLLYSTSPLTGRSLLTSIEQFGKDVDTGGVPLPAHTFTYQNDTLGKGFYPISGDPPTPPATLEDVTWTNHVNTVANGNTLMRTGASGWDAGAASTRALAAGDGYVEVATQGGASSVFGLSNGDGDATPGDIDFALFQNNETGKLYVWENGVQKAEGSSLVAGQPLRIEIQGNKVIYKQNGAVVYQATKRLAYPLLVDASIYSFNGTINDAVLNGSLRYVSHWCGGVLMTGDVSGDGRTDQVCHKGSEGTLQVAVATSSGFDAATTWATGQMFSELTMGDFNSDGKTDVAFFANGAGDFFVALSTGTSFATPSHWGNATAVAPGGVYTCQTTPQYQSVALGTGDFNGDGIVDVSCKVGGKAEAFIGLSNGTTSFSFSIFGQLGCEPIEVTGAIDFDGDGKDDWYCAGVTNSVLLVFPSTGSSFVFPAFGSLDSSFCSGDYVLGDFNGDGRTDAACGNGGNIALSTGREFAIQPGTFGALCPSGTNVFAADVDGDGASEIVCNNANAPAHDIEIRKWKAGALTAPETWKASWCSASVHAGDFNGDGKTDLVCSALSSPAVAGTGGLQSDLLSVAGNGMGGTSATTYTSSVNFQNTNNPPPKFVVTSVATNDGRSGSSTTTYSYSGGYMDRQERRFLGFREVTQTLPCIDGDCPVVATTLKQDLASAGKAERIERRDGAGHMLRRSEYVYTTSEAPPRTSLLTREDSFFGDALGAEKQTRAVHQYDSYGNRTQTVFHGDLDEPGDELTSTWAFAHNTSAYIVDRVSTEQQFSGEGTGGLKLTERHYHYDGQGHGTPPSDGYPTRIESWLDTEARFVGRDLAYDSWGNLTQVLDETDRPTTIGYDSTYHVFPTSVTNGAGEQETTTWHFDCGVPSVSEDANGQASTFEVDKFCRPWRANYPLQDFEYRTYHNLGSPTTQHVRIETPSATDGDGSGPDYILEYFDGLGRPYKTIKKGPASNPTIRKDTVYNARGGIASETAPYYEGVEPVHTTAYKIDSLDRVTETLFPDGNSVEKAYHTWMETATDEHGHPTTSHFDAYGRRVQTIQTLGLGDTLHTYHAYDDLGRLVGITDPIGIQWSWTFDSLGRMTARTDPDSGSWSFGYDDAGRLEEQNDAKGQQTEFTYDSAGRLHTKTNSAGVVTFNHSEVRPGYFNIGRMTGVLSPTGSIAMNYDAAGRPAQQQRWLDGSLYIAERRYDSAGRLRGITFPDGDAIGTVAEPLGYDAAGRLYSIPYILNEVRYDGAGRPTFQKAADTPLTVTTKTYSSRGFLTDIETTGNGSIQDLHYEPDAAGLVDFVTSSLPNEGWDYSYDDLHRLTSAQSLSFPPTESQTFQYDAIGRITHNSKVGAYAYPQVGYPHPHGPDTVNGGLYGYDLNGNVVSGGDRSIQWNANNLITQVTKAGTTTDFTYDGLGERVKKTSGGPPSLYPMGDDYEVANGVITKYVNVAGLGVIAKKVGSTRYWLHTDRLGSIQTITDDAGAIVQQRTYRPYGDKIADTTGYVESRGYIAQRQDPETGLTYLHARYYDSALGLFLSPDPIQADLNTYAYGFSDPINWSDASGLEPGGGPCPWCPGTDYGPNGWPGLQPPGHWLKDLFGVIDWIFGGPDPDPLYGKIPPRGGFRPRPPGLWPDGDDRTMRGPGLGGPDAPGGPAPPFVGLPLVPPSGPGGGPPGGGNPGPRGGGHAPTVPKPPSSRSLLLGRDLAVVPFVGGEASIAFYWTPATNDFGLTWSVPDGVGYGFDIGTSPFAGYTDALVGRDLNANFNMTAIPLGGSFSTDPLQGGGITGASITKDRFGASVTYTYGRRWSIRDWWRRRR
jgi:RHS repeat-associated protein